MCVCVCINTLYNVMHVHVCDGECMYMCVHTVYIHVHVQCIAYVCYHILKVNPHTHSLPNALHKPWIQSLVVILEVNPASHSCNYILPFRGIPHHNLPAFCVVISHTHFLYVFVTLKCVLCVRVHACVCVCVSVCVCVCVTFIPRVLSISYSTGRP